MNCFEDLRRMLCRELDELTAKGELSAGDLETAHKLTDTIKNIDKIKCMEEEGYSADGGWNAAGVYSRDSYARDSRGRYSRGRYSMADGKEDIRDRIRIMMDDPNLTSSDRSALKRAMEALR